MIFMARMFLIIMLFSFQLPVWSITESRYVIPEVTEAQPLYTEYLRSQPSNKLPQDSENLNWERILKGSALVYTRTGEGFSVKKTISLCSDYRFVYSDVDSYISKDAYHNFTAGVRGQQAGSWKIAGDALLLLWSDHTQSRSTLSYRYLEQRDEWGIFIDDERWRNMVNRKCQ